MKIIYFNNEEAWETYYPGYFATRSGKILSVKVKGGQGKLDYNHPREHNYKVDKDGYLEVLFSDNNNRKYMRVHRVIWETFNGPILDDLTIDHIDGCITNNSLNNLQILSREDNTRKATKNKKSPKRFLYMVNNQIMDRQQIQKEFGFSNKFWYNPKNKINENDFQYKEIIFQRV